jgi:1,4-dihydroxy-2-naphthoyl-CoA hydrolase
MPLSPWEQLNAELPASVIPLERTLDGFLDLEWLELSEDIARARLVVREDLKQSLGLLHGGVYSAVAESLASVGTIYGVWRDGYVASGMSNRASFLRPVLGGTLEAVSRCQGRDEDRWVWGTDFTDERDRLCAIVEVTIALRPFTPPDA